MSVVAAFRTVQEFRAKLGKWNPDRLIQGTKSDLAARFCGALSSLFSFDKRVGRSECGQFILLENILGISPPLYASYLFLNQKWVNKDCVCRFCGCVIGAARLSSEQTFLIAGFEGWINYPGPVRGNRHDACPDTQCWHVGGFYGRRVDPVRESMRQGEQKGKTADCWGTDRQNCVRRGRQVKFYKTGGRSGLGRTAALLGISQKKTQRHQGENPLLEQ